MVDLEDSGVENWVWWVFWPLEQTSRRPVPRERLWFFRFLESFFFCVFWNFWKKKKKVYIKGIWPKLGSAGNPCVHSTRMCWFFFLFSLIFSLNFFFYFVVLTSFLLYFDYFVFWENLEKGKGKEKKKKRNEGKRKKEKKRKNVLFSRTQCLERISIHPAY